jgi:hypothetical protein
MVISVDMEHMEAGIRVEQLRNWGLIPSSGKRFSHLWCVHTGCGDNSASCGVGSRASSLSVKLLECQTVQSSPCNAMVKILWTYTSIRP